MRFGGRTSILTACGSTEADVRPLAVGGDRDAGRSDRASGAWSAVDDRAEAVDLKAWGC
jgi:hypothetical protein